MSIASSTPYNIYSYFTMAISLLCLLALVLFFYKLFTKKLLSSKPSVLFLTILTLLTITNLALYHRPTNITISPPDTSVYAIEVYSTNPNASGGYDTVRTYPEEAKFAELLRIVNEASYTRTLPILAAWNRSSQYHGVEASLHSTKKDLSYLQKILVLFGENNTNTVYITSVRNGTQQTFQMHESSSKNEIVTFLQDAFYSTP